MVKKQDVLAHRGLALSRNVLRRLHKLGIFVQSNVGLEHQHLARRYVKVARPCKPCKHGWLRALLSVAYNFGFRKAELPVLRVGQIDLKSRTIRLLSGETKTDKGRTVVNDGSGSPLSFRVCKGQESGRCGFHVGGWSCGERFPPRLGKSREGGGRA